MMTVWRGAWPPGWACITIGIWCCIIAGIGAAMEG
eukprot:CAMPEP_0177211884 /NCGR_PEP_ID=MMETSP0367-20130122/32329_1 /TAXON_ID=447022 ORGANISM="Scrippsiella hangoei-like, Strain SHHI-4" /NCGR_SAMPLE_ID=MMETSP0367 /ASSEMBLY_ACC=CAM_ASM_000362 /LENGTH=34 /DNA_ID= /DNA_START= /DNA_END= /DNA_ORIENTATION=